MNVLYNLESRDRLPGQTVSTLFGSLISVDPLTVNTSFFAPQVSFSYPGTDSIRDLQKAHDRLVELVSEIDKIFTRDPATWGKDVFVTLKNFIKAAESKEMKSFVSE